jgi:hypothetical protein
MRTLLGLIFSEGALRTLGTVLIMLLATLVMFWIFEIFRVSVDSASDSLNQIIPTHQNIPTPKPRDGLSLKDQVVGIYELKEKKDIFKLVFLGNGIMEEYENDKILQEYKLEIINGAVHNEDKKGGVYILNINPDGSLTGVATILSGKRTDLSIDKQPTYNKIPKEPVEGLSPIEKVVGIYELNIYKWVLLNNGTMEAYVKGKKIDVGKWYHIIKDGEVRIDGREGVGVYSINPNGSLTHVAGVVGRRQEELPRERQLTYIKTN